MIFILKNTDCYLFYPMLQCIYKLNILRGNMNLKEYVDDRSSFSITRMAKELDCSYAHLYGVIHRKYRASYKFAKLIEIYTRGKVKAVDIVECELIKKTPK